MLSLRRLWPLVVLLTVEAAALALLTAGAYTHAPPATRLSLLVSSLILLSGLLPALLRPGPETLLAGCLATVLAALLVLPFDRSQLPGYAYQQPMLALLPPYLVLRLANGVCIGPLTFHLTARFPRRSAIQGKALAAIYLASLGLLLALLLTTLVPLRILASALLVTWSIGLVLAAGYLLLRAGRQVDPANPRPAQQARLLFTCVSLAGLPALLRPLGLVLQVELIPYTLMLVVLTIIPLGVAYAVLRHDLFGIDRALRRALVYGLFSLLVLVVYFALTLGLTAVLANSLAAYAWPERRGLAAVLSLLLAAAAFQPTHRRLQGWIDRLLYPDRLNFQRAVEQTRHALERVDSRQEVLRLLTDELPPRLGAEWARLTLAPEPDIPDRDHVEPAWNTRLIVGGQALGRYWLGPRRSGPSYDRDEQAQLHALAGQAALALAYADTIDALRSLNRDLEQRVAERTTQVLDQQRSLAAYVERQRLARDLHDSVTQALFSIHLSARALRGLVQRDPPAAVDGLKELEAAAQQAQSEMRALLAQLRAPAPEPEPGPALASPLDLVALLVEHCEQLRREPGPDGQSPLLDVRLDAPASLSLPPALAQAALHIAREALHNVVKHGQVRQAVCRLEYEAGCLHLLVADQGQGFDLQATPTGHNGGHYGLQGIQERLSLLNGRCHIVSSPGQGTIIQIEIPVL